MSVADELNRTPMVKRSEDMGHGSISLMKQDDGDVCITVHGRALGGNMVFASIEFCSIGTGGGRSPHTREALLYLFDAIEKDTRATAQESE